MKKKRYNENEFFKSREEHEETPVHYYTQADGSFGHSLRAARLYQFISYLTGNTLGFRSAARNYGL
jgi:hypothetical protein